MSGQERAALVGEAEQAFERALEVFTRAEWPTVWASVQYQLGFALRLKLFSTSAEESQHLLGRTVVAHQQALEVLTLENDPEMWGIMQTGLGSALLGSGPSGNRSGKRASIRGSISGLPAGFEGLYPRWAAATMGCNTVGTWRTTPRVKVPGAVAKRAYAY